MEKIRARLEAAGILDATLEAEVSALGEYGLLRITDILLRDAVEDFLCNVPLRFFTDPASKSGRFHPPWQNRRHGTLRSIVESCVILPNMARHIPEILDLNFDPHPAAIDVALAATIISDVWKKEDEGDVHHGAMHGHVAADHWLDFTASAAPGLPPMTVAEVAEACRLHYGLYTPGWDRAQPLPPIARLVNLCDVITSLPSLGKIYTGKYPIG